MIRDLHKEELRYIVYGSSFYGGGGGGSMDEGEALLAAMLAEDPELTLKMYDVEDMEDDPAVVSTMVAALGSPVATKGRTFQDESVNAVKGMAEEAGFGGRTLKYVYSGEQGGGNTLLPLYAAWKNGLPILNTDGNGRAVPELNTGLLPVHGIPTSPVVLASEQGDTIVGRAKDPMDSKACENIARYMCQAYDQGIGFAAWMMNKEDHLKASAVGQMTKTIEVGRVLAGSTADTVAENLSKCFAASGEAFKMVIPAGTITNIDIDSAGGFDTGVTTIRDDVTGAEYRVTFQNENLFVEDPEGKVIVTIPSIISLLNLGLDGEVRALSNSETKVGQKVALTITRAADRWYDLPECYTCWDGVMVSAGYCRANEEVSL